MIIKKKPNIRTKNCTRYRNDMKTRNIIVEDIFIVIYYYFYHVLIYGVYIYFYT